MPRPPADPSREATPARAQCICDLLQPSTTAGSASSSRFPTPVDHLVLLCTKQQRWLLFRSWPGCTMTTERWRKEDPSETTMHERVKMPSKEDLSLSIQMVFRSAC